MLFTENRKPETETPDLPDLLIATRDLCRYFTLAGPWGRGPTLKAVDGVSLTLKTGETLGLVGESGCGKSTLGRVLLALLPPTRGQVLFGGEDLFNLPHQRLKELRRQMQIIFQDPYSSLNPRMTVRQTLEEPYLIHRLGTRAQRRAWAAELIVEVGLQKEHLERYPHEFSGGQRQRLGIARALALKPRLIVADEPVSALDVSIQAQILNLLNQLQERYGLTYLFISHDLSVISQISTRIAVMYLGRLVDLAPRDVFDTARLHPYTEALLAAVPLPDPERAFTPPQLQGDPPSPLHIPTGCPFHPRCPESQFPVCRDTVPQFRETAPAHWVSCHFR
jgi:peptide/nickel transport system ATP-binding protein